MPAKDYKIYLNEFARIIVYLLSDGNTVLNFVVKLEYFYKGKWSEIERFDCYHNSVHRDILNKKGKKKRVVKYPLVNNKSGLNFAIEEFKANYEFLIWRFLNED